MRHTEDYDITDRLVCYTGEVHVVPEGNMVGQFNRQSVARRNALFVLFFISGFAIASWITRTPAIRDLLGASTSTIGLMLLGLSAGSMSGVLSSGPLVGRWGTRPVILVGNIGIVASTPTIGLGAWASSYALVTLGLMFFGLGIGISEVAMNVEGADVERSLGKPIMPTLHGSFSLGEVFGAGLGILFTAINFPVTIHLVSVGVVIFFAFILAIRFIPAGVGIAQRLSPAESPATIPPRTPLWRDFQLLGIGVIILAMALAEGSASDWLPLLMVDGHGISESMASASFALFAVGMVTGRFLGTPIVARLGRPFTLRISAVIGMLGLGIVLFIDQPALVVVAVLLWGLGASLGFPLAISAAGESGPDATKRVAIVSAAGYIAFLVGPPFLGFLGEHVGLRSALLVVLVFMSVAIFFAGATGVKKTQRSTNTHEPTVPDALSADPPAARLPESGSTQ